MRTKNRHIAKILMMTAVFLLFPVVSSAHVNGLRIADSITHINIFDPGRISVPEPAVVLAKNQMLNAGNCSFINGIDILALVGHAKLLGSLDNSFNLTLTGQIENLSDKDVMLNIYVEPGDKGLDPVDRNYIGSFFIRANGMLELAHNAKLEQNLSRFLAHYVADCDVDSASLFIKVLTKDASPAKVRIERLELVSSPVFHATYIIDNNPDGTSPSNAAVSDATLSGTIANRGQSRMRFVLVAEIQGDMTAGFSDLMIADGVLAPKETVEIGSLLVDEADFRLRQAMSEAAFGGQVQVHVLVFSEDQIKAKVQNLQLKTEVSYQ